VKTKRLLLSKKEWCLGLMEYYSKN